MTSGSFNVSDGAHDNKGFSEDGVNGTMYMNGTTVDVPNGSTNGDEEEKKEEATPDMVGVGEVVSPRFLLNIYIFILHSIKVQTAILRIPY